MGYCLWRIRLAYWIRENRCEGREGYPPLAFDSKHSPSKCLIDRGIPS